MTLFHSKTKLPERITFSDGGTGHGGALWEEDSGAAFREAYAAAEDAGQLIDNSTASVVARDRAYDRRIRDIHASTGVKLEAPTLTGSERPETPEDMRAYRLDPQAWQTALFEQRKAAWRQRLDELAVQFPDAREAIGVDRPIEQDMREIVQAADARMNRAMADPALSGLQRFAAAVGGGIVAGVQDPLQVATMGFGGSGSGRTVLGRIGQAILTEGAINAGVEGALQLQAQGWRQSNGLESGIGLALTQVGIAGLFGGGVGGAVQGGRELATLLGRNDRATVEAFQNAAAGTATADELRLVADAAGIDIDDLDLRTADAARAADTATEAATILPPAELAPELADDLLAQAQRQLDAGEIPAVDTVPAAPARDPSLRPMLDDVAEADPSWLDVDGVRYDFGDPLHRRLFELGRDLARLNGIQPDDLDTTDVKLLFRQHADEVDDLYGQMADYMIFDDVPRNKGQFAWSAMMHFFDAIDEAQTRPRAVVEVPNMIDPEFVNDWYRAVRSTAGAPAPETALRRFMVLGKPVSSRAFDPKDVDTDAAAYQYKDGGDEAGVTSRLRDVRQWDPTASGKVFVHERLDGRRLIADGHQRLGLAKRLQAEGQDVELDGYLLREADGWTVADVRAIAAKKNLQEGSGTVMDAARILRDRPDILDASMPVSGPMLRAATALARLADDAWRMVTNEIAQPYHGAAVGRMVADPAQHGAVLADLARIDPPERLTDMMVKEILAASVRMETQIDMFGQRAVARSLLAERVKVMDAALKLLRQDQKLFAALSRNADVIEAAGNVLDTEGNASRATTAETIGALIERLARSKGPVSGYLTQAAERFADGSNAQREAERFIGDVRRHIDEHGMAHLMRDEAEPALKPDTPAPEPATPDAEQASLFTLQTTPQPAATPADIATALAASATASRRMLADPPGKRLDAALAASETADGKLINGEPLTPEELRLVRDRVDAENAANGWEVSLIADDFFKAAEARGLTIDLDDSRRTPVRDTDLTLKSWQMVVKRDGQEVGRAEWADELAEILKRESAAPPPLPDEPDLWTKMPDGTDGQGNIRYTDHKTEIGKADTLDAAADLVAACKGD